MKKAFILSFVIVFWASADDLSFKHLTVEDGLSQGSIYEIVQDSSGYLWFATEDGLNRYDGYGFKIYRNDPADSTSLVNNFIRAMSVAPDGTIWLGSYRGLCIYNPQKDSFEPSPVKILRNSNISAIDILNRQWAYIGTYNSLFALYNFKTGETHVVGRIDTLRAVTSGITSYANGSVMVGDTLYVGSQLGIIKYFSAQKKLRIVPWRKDQPGFNIQITSNHALLNDDEIIFGSASDGLIIYSIRSGKWRYQPEYLTALTGNSEIIDIYRDKEGVIWLATQHRGIIRWDIKAGKAANYRYKKDRPESLSGNFIESLFMDREGTLWVGSNANGLNFYNPLLHKFKLVNRSSRPAGLSDDMIYALYSAPYRGRDHIWVGTDKGGLNLYDPRTGRVTVFQPDPRKAHAIPGTSVRAVYRDRKQRYWIGLADDGLARFDPEKNRFYRVKAFDQRSIRTIGEDSSASGNYLWVGTSGSGLYRYHTPTGRVKRYSVEMNGSPFKAYDVRAWLTDKTGIAWIGTFDNGLHRFDPRADRFTIYNNIPDDSLSLSHNIVLSLCEQWTDGQQYIWAGTADGLNRLHVATGKIWRIREKDGLPNGVVYSVRTDEDGMLWLTTNMGLSRFDPRSGRFRSFTTDDGLQSMEFNVGASWGDASGNIYVGGINGFNIFNPRDIRENPYRPPVVINRFSIFNNPVPFKTTIELNYDQDFFSLEFAALSFLAPGKNRYAYMMEGFDKEWIYSGTRRYAGYTNLDPGRYIFRVKASNNDGVWNDSGAAVSLEIAPPPWRTGWAYLFYLIAVIGLVKGGQWVVANRKSLMALRKRRISHYKLLELVGEGGLGSVFRAVDTNTDKIVAVKLLRRELANDPENRRRFQNEGQLLAQLDHPHVIRAFEIGQLKNEMYLAMEFLPGPTLAEHNRQGAPLAQEEVLRLSREILMGLQAIHARDIIHRDLKTANIMFDGRGRLRIMDFGLARSHLVSLMTTMGTVMGTLGFVAPEQITNADIDQRVDIFAFGVILYDMLCGQLPFSGENEMALIHAVFSTVPPPPSSLRDDIVPGWDALVARCLEKSPADRYEQARDVLIDLDRMAEENKIEAS